MSSKLREMIARAAKKSVKEMAEVHRGEYRPQIRVVKLGDPLDSLREIPHPAR